MKTIVLAFITVTYLYSGVSYAEGLQTLIQAGKNMGEVQKALDEETERYEQVKQDVDSGRLKKGVSKDDVVAQYGEPVVANIDTKTKREKLVYMPATSSFFKGPRICLYFNNDDILEEIVFIQ